VVLAQAIGNDGPSCEARRVSIRSSIRSITMGRRDCFFFFSAGPPSSPTKEASGATLCWPESIPAQGQPFAGIGLPQLPQLTASLRDTTEGGALL
jgi:hypothetical protein